MISIVCIIIVYACSLTLTAAMPTTTPSMTTPTTKQKVALVAALPCYFTESASNPDYIDTLGAILSQDAVDVDSQTAASNIQASLSKLKPVSFETRDMLSSAMDNTVARDWGCHGRIMDMLRPHVDFHWTWNATSDMDIQEVERLKTLIRFSGYIVFLQTGLKLPSAANIFTQDSIKTLKNVQRKITTAACQVRDLLPMSRALSIYNKAVDSEIPTGQRYLETVQPSEQAQMIRYLVGLALEDMLKTFSHFEVTQSDIHLDGRK